MAIVFLVIQKLKRIEYLLLIKKLPECISVIMGIWVTLGDAKHAKTSWTDVNGVSVGVTTDCPWHCPHM